MLIYSVIRPSVYFRLKVRQTWHLNEMKFATQEKVILHKPWGSLQQYFLGLIFFGCFFLEGVFVQGVGKLESTLKNKILKIVGQIIFIHIGLFWFGLE